MKESRVPRSYWKEALKHSTYLYNQTTSSVLRMLSKHGKTFKRCPNVSKLRAFGCLSYFLSQGRSKRISVRPWKEGHLSWDEESISSCPYNVPKTVLHRKHVTIDKFSHQLERKSKISVSLRMLILSSLENKEIESDQTVDPHTKNTDDFFVSNKRPYDEFQFMTSEQGYPDKPIIHEGDINNSEKKPSGRV